MIHVNIHNYCSQSNMYVYFQTPLETVRLSFLLSAGAVVISEITNEKPLMALSFLNQVFLRLVAISLWCSTEWTPSGRFVSPAASQFLLSHCFVSKKHSPFANYFLHCLFQCFISFQH